MTMVTKPGTSTPARNVAPGNYPDEPATLVEALDRHVAVRGDKVFTRHLLGGSVTELTFAQFSRRAEFYAAHLQALGLSAGDVALIFLPTSPETLPAFVGAMMIGAVPSLMPCPSAKQHASVYWPSHVKLLDRITPRILLTNRENAAQMAEHGLAVPGRSIVAIEDLGEQPAALRRVGAGSGDVALLQHSSGTTSLKKGVALTHRAILRQIESYSARLVATADDNLVSWLPIYHDMGLIACSMMPLIMGQSITILDPFQWLGRPTHLFDAIERHDGHFVWLPNFAFEHMVRATPQDYAGDLSSMRAFVDCSEPCKTETVDRFAARFVGNGVRRDMLHACYAMAETVFAVSQTVPGTDVGSAVVDLDTLQTESRAADVAPQGKSLTLFSNGRPMDGMIVTIRDGDSILDENRVGEIVVSGEFLFDGYFNDPALTAERLIDGWFHTRDRGFLRDGELYVLGRNDDLIIISGRNLHANEVELVVNSVAGLKPGRAVAFGVFNETNASEELVIVAERDESSVEDGLIQNKVREIVFDHTGMDVKNVVVVDPGWLVKTTSGKISRESNKRRYIEMQARPDAEAASPQAATEDSFADVARIIARTFRCSAARITRDTVATDISGWDSLAHSTLVLKIEQDLGVRFGDDEIFGFDNVGALVDRTTELRAAGGQVSDRVVAQNERFSIVAFGEVSDAPDLVVFAGAALKFGGHVMTDFESTIRGTPWENSRRFFITDPTKRWFTDSVDVIAEALNGASDRPKILIGNSMGGYGALKFAPLLHHVMGILAFAPQPNPGPKLQNELSRDEWYVHPVPGIPTCIIYGEVEDESGKKWTAKTFVDPDNHTRLEMPNCGHNVVPTLSDHGLLAKILTYAMNPTTMGANIKRLIDSVEPDRAELLRNIRRIGRKKKGGENKMRKAMKYFSKRYPDTADNGSNS